MEHRLCLLKKVINVFFREEYVIPSIFVELYDILYGSALIIVN